MIELVRSVAIVLLGIGGSIALTFVILRLLVLSSSRGSRDHALIAVLVAAAVICFAGALALLQS